MVRYLTGDIFSSPAQVITNPVNCVGVMGAGLALAFKKRYSAMFKDYKSRCDRGEVVAGRTYLYEDDEIQILNFPTKRHWKDASRLDDIEAGLRHLAIHHADMGIFYLALPPLGCGLGGLNWPDVRGLIDKHLGDLADLDVLVYEPHASQSKAPDDCGNLNRDDSQSGLAAQSNL